MNRFSNLFLALGTGLLLWAAWPVSPLTLLIFIAWVPLLWLETRVKSRKKFFGLVYLAMFTWNVTTTWWIWNASPPGAIGAFIANSLLMCFPWLGFRIVKKWLGEKIGYASLVIFWMSFEYLHLHDWGLSWPWLTLGNALAIHPQWIQWYEYTGTSGGTLWILLVNIFLFLHLQHNVLRREAAKTYRYLFPGILLLILPIGLSLMTKTNKAVRGSSSIVIVQPNIDPYEKVSEAANSFQRQLQKLIVNSEQSIDENTVMVVWPETALYMGSGLDEQHLQGDPDLELLWLFLKRHPGMLLFTGIESYRQFDTPTKQSIAFNGANYESYNGAVLLNQSGPLGFYHKSMLVPGVETLPWFLKFIDKWFEKFGGTTAGYARQSERTVLDTKRDYRIAPSICYESIYGEFMSRYVRNGANLICIITNDGWWKNTPGHKQHMNYARLRAIETRTWVVRSANTGISCFIDPNGTVINPLGYNKEGSLKLAFEPTASKTFFVKHGDVLSFIAAILSAIIIFWTLARRLLLKRRTNQ